jgi:hypothetical protein
MTGWKVSADFRSTNYHLISGELETKRFVVKPGYRSGDFVKTRLFENWIVRSLFKVDYHLLLGDLDPPVGVDEPEEEGLGH